MTFKEYWSEMRYLSIRIVHNAYAQYHRRLLADCLEISSNPNLYGFLRHYTFRWKKYWGALLQASKTMSIMSEALSKAFMQGLFEGKDEKTYPAPENWAKISEALARDSKYKH